MPTDDERDDDDLLCAEAARLHERYTVELIERYDLCPWARPARLHGEIERHVLLQSSNDPEPTLALLARIEHSERPPPVAIAIYPRLALAPLAFDQFAAEVKRLDQQRHGGKPVYVSATFHPDYPLVRRSASSVVPFFRRSPDPSLQLVRLSILEAARGGDHGKFVFDYSAASWERLRRRAESRSVTERITGENHAALEREGAAAFQKVLDDIAADRARSYARFAL